MKIICVGRNYAKHAKELGNPIPSEPLFFMKPDSAILRNNDNFYLPDFSNDVHFEVEIYIRINKRGKHIDKKYAGKYFNELGIAVDITARDVQENCKKFGLPWEKAKGFDGSAPISKTLPVTAFDDLNKVDFSLHKNGVLVQKGVTGDMLFSMEDIVSEASKYFTLKIGDLIFTGTPAGTGKLELGDFFQAFINQKEMLQFIVK